MMLYIHFKFPVNVELKKKKKWYVIGIKRGKQKEIPYKYRILDFPFPSFFSSNSINPKI